MNLELLPLRVIESKNSTVGVRERDLVKKPKEAELNADMLGRSPGTRGQGRAKEAVF